MTLLHDWQTNPTEDHPLVRLGRLLQHAGYAFTTISPPSHRRVNAREHNAAASDLRGVFGWNRPFDGALLEPEMLHLMDSAGILLTDGARYRSALRASTLGGQLYFHSAYPTHDVDSVFFGPDTYRYQQVIDTALANSPPAPVRRAADIGCGAAPGAVIVARHYPQAEVWGVDINPRALALAAVNVRVAGLENVQLARSDLLAALDGEFDLIVSNPPFMVDDDQRTYCHGGGSLGEGLSLSIVACAIKRLAPGGQLVLYTCVAMIDGSDPFMESCRAMLAAAGEAWNWHYQETDPDVFGGELGDDLHARTDRIAAVTLIIRRPLQP